MYMTARNLAKRFKGEFPFVSERWIRDMQMRGWDNLPYIEERGTRWTDDAELRRFIDRQNVRR